MHVVDDRSAAPDNGEDHRGPGDVAAAEGARHHQEIQAQFQAWSARRLDDLELDYLFLDGSHFKYHANASAEPVLAAWGIDTDGKPVFVGLDAASSESGDAWEGFLTGLGERGLRCPLLVISDGAAGLIGALERTMGAALRQRCLVHRARNVRAKVPKNAQAQVKGDYWAIFDVPDTIEPGLHVVGYVQKRIDSFDKRWRDAYPAAVRCLLDDRDSLTVYLRFPREHWTRVRHSNFIERTFGETRRRVKVIGRLPGEHCCLKLVWAVLDRASAGWRGFTMTPAGLRLLADLRRSLHDPPRLAAEANPASATHTSRCRFHDPRSSLTARMIRWSLSLPGNVQQRTGIPSRVTAIAITTWGRSSRWSLDLPNRRAPYSTGLQAPSSVCGSGCRSASSSGTSTSQ